jgi:hypothetical protein
LLSPGYPACPAFAARQSILVYCINFLSALALPVEQGMMRPAQPDYIQWLGIVGVVSIRDNAFADSARLAQ